MRPHVCPWWGGYFIDNGLRRWVHDPQRILRPYVRSGMTVLDFGCGMGMFAIAAARLVGNGGQVIAVDLQPQMLEVLRRRAAQAGVADRIHTHRCPADSLNLSTPCDFLFAFYSAHETPDLRTLFRDFRACVRPNGTVLVVEPCGHVTTRDFQQLVAIAQEAGFAEQQRPRIRWSHTVVLRPVALPGAGQAEPEHLSCGADPGGVDSIGVDEGSEAGGAT